MAKLILVRKTDDKIPTLTKAQKKDIMNRLSNPKKVRVQRPALTEFILSGQMNKMKIVTPHEVFSQWVNDYAEKGWEIPGSDLGRVGKATLSSAESIKIWIHTHFGDIVKPGSFTVIPMED